jgi:hypothetical protein
MHAVGEAAPIESEWGPLLADWKLAMIAVAHDPPNTPEAWPEARRLAAAMRKDPEDSSPKVGRKYWALCARAARSAGVWTELAKLPAVPGFRIVVPDVDDPDRAIWIRPPRGWEPGRRADSWRRTR